jgi:hypothetical protein
VIRVMQIATANPMQILTRLYDYCTIMYKIISTLIYATCIVLFILHSLDRLNFCRLQLRFENTRILLTCCKMSWMVSRMGRLESVVYLEPSG